MANQPLGRQPVSPQPVSPPPARRSPLQVLAVLVFLILVLAWLGSRGSSGAADYPYATDAPRATGAPAARWQPPNDLTLMEGDLAYRWLTKGEFSCTYSDGACWGITGMTQYGCPNSLYVELGVSDSAGTAIGYTNATAGAVSPLQRVKLVFDALEPGASKARVTKVSCY